MSRNVRAIALFAGCGLDEEFAVKRIRLAQAIIVAATSLAATESPAQMQGYQPLKQSESVWKTMDNCHRNAFKRFPDYTPEGRAKRERAERQCLEANNSPYTPPAPSNGSATPQR